MWDRRPRAAIVRSRLQAIATPLVPNMEKVQIIPPPKDVDPRVLAWKGAAVLGKMDGVADLWVTGADWVSAPLPRFALPFLARAPRPRLVPEPPFRVPFLFPFSPSLSATVVPSLAAERHVTPISSRASRLAPTLPLRCRGAALRPSEPRAGRCRVRERSSVWRGSQQSCTTCACSRRPACLLLSIFYCFRPCTPARTLTPSSHPQEMLGIRALKERCFFL